MKNRHESAYTVLEMMIVVTIVGLLAAIAVPNYMRHRDASRLTAIYNNLRVLEAAKDQWAVESHQATGANVADISVVSNYLGFGTIHPVVQEAYYPNPIGTPAGAQLPGTTPLGSFPAGSIIVLTNNQ